MHPESGAGNCSEVPKRLPPSADVVIFSQMHGIFSRMNDRILVLQHSRHEGPAALGRYLDDRGIGWTLCRLDHGAPVPEAVDGWRGVVLLGGVMSAYDDTIPFIRAELRFIEALLAADRPVFGICLGAQLLARALGARVAPMPEPEIGWHPVQVAGRGASDRLGMAPGTAAPHVLQWHGDAFDLPRGAERLFTGGICPEQGFRVGGSTLAVQFHPEVDLPTLRRWVGEEGGPRGERPHVQPGEQILAEAPSRLTALRPLSEALYQAWLESAAITPDGR